MRLFRQEAIDARRRRVRGAIVLSRPLRSASLAYLLAGIAAAALVFLFSVEFHRKEAVRGYITSSRGVIALRAVESGRLGALFVQVGDPVRAGDPLFEVVTDVESGLGPTRESQLATTENRLREIDDQFALIRLAYRDRHAKLTRQIDSLRRATGRMRTQLTLKRQAADVAVRNLERIERLRDGHYVSDRDRGVQLETVLSRQAELMALENRIAGNESEIGMLTLDVDRLPVAEAKERSELAIRRNSLQQSRLEQTALASYRVRAPVSGYVSAVQGHPGQMLVAQSAVLTIVPENAELVAHLLAPSRAVGFLREGMPVHLLVDAFPYQRFGVQKGRVREVSRSTYKPGELAAPFRYAEPAYRVVVQLDRDHVRAYGRQYPLQVDMTLTGDLIVDRRSLVDWMLAPLKSVRL